MATSTFTATIESIAPVSSGVWRIVLANGNAFLHNNFELITVYGSASNQPVVLDPFLNVSNIDYHPYNALLNNASAISNTSYLQEVDYDRGQVVASNIAAIRSNEAVRAEVNEYIHNSAGLTSGRYTGKQLVGLETNKFTPANEDWYGDKSYGIEPVQENKQIYFAYFDWAGGTTPEFKDKTAFHIRYLIDKDGNTLTPDTDEISYINLVQNFIEQTNVTVRLDNPTLAGSSNMSILNGTKKILKTGVRPEPIIYTQTGSNFTSSISFGDESITDYTFLAQTTGSQTINAYAEETIVFTSESYDANNSYDKTTGVYTFTDTPAPQLFQFEVNVRGTINTWGNDPFDQESITLQILSGSSVRAQTSWNVAGGNTYFAFNKTLRTPTFGFGAFQEGDAISVQLVLDRMTVTLSQASFKLNQFPGNQVIASSTTENLWHSGSEYFPLYGYVLPDTYIVASNNLARAYDLQQNDIPSSGFNTLQYPFTLQVGDEIRFENNEYKAYMITDVSAPSEPFRTPGLPLYSGYLVVKLNKPIAKNTNVNYFAVRRFIKDGSYIILDTNKPGGATSGGTLVPEYITDSLTDNLNSALKIVRANDKSIQGQV